MQKIIIAAATAALLGAGTVAAEASPITISGSYDVSYSVSGVQPSVTDELADPFSFALEPGHRTRKLDFFTVNPGGDGFSTASGTVTASFSFNEPGSANSNGSAAYEANYFWIFGQDGNLTWEKPDPLEVDFADGAVLDIALYNASELDWVLTPKVRFTLKDGPTSVPEPGSLALLGTALLGLGIVFYRRKRA